MKPNLLSFERNTGKGFLLIVLTMAFQIFFLFNSSLHAQDGQKQDLTVAKAKLSEQEWKALEGYFQNPGNKDLTVQFSVNHDTLLGKTLWNNNTFHLLPQTSLSFASIESGEEGHVRLAFIKDSLGVVNKISLGENNNNVWNRVKDYKAIVHTEMQHTPDQLKPYEGLFQFAKDSIQYIQFTVKGNELILKQHWDGREISFVPESALDFFCRDIPQFSLSFKKDDAGNIAQAIAFRNDVWNKTKKPVMNAAFLKSCEGKFKSKDDPDNVVQLTARNNSLMIRQLWDGKEIEVAQLTTSYFYNEAQSFPLQILRDKDGTASQIIILGMDYFEKVK